MQRIGGGVPVVAAAFAAAFILGCVSNSAATWAQLRTRASFDFNCPRSEISIEELDKRSAGATGCGHRATYIESCESYAYRGTSVRGNCTWVLNGDSKSTRKAKGDEEEE